MIHRTVDLYYHHWLVGGGGGGQKYIHLFPTDIYSIATPDLHVNPARKKHNIFYILAQQPCYSRGNKNTAFRSSELHMTSKKTVLC
jgi:hypothetical protein